MFCIWYKLKFFFKKQYFLILIGLSFKRKIISDPALEILQYNICDFEQSGFTEKPSVDSWADVIIYNFASILINSENPENYN